MLSRKKKVQYQATRFQSEQSRLEPPHRSYWEWVLLAILIFSCAISAYLLVNSRRFVVKQVQLHQHGHHIQIAQLTAIISKQTKGTSFSFSCDRLRRRLLLLPWVQSVSVRRHWPDAVSVWLKERQAVAVWDESALLDKEGVVFYPPLETFPADLPRLSSHDQEPADVLAVYEKIAASLKTAHLRLVSMNAVSASSWELLLPTGTVIMLPKEKADQALQHWLSVYPQLMKGRMQEVKRIDLRYSHGMAVQWVDKKRFKRAKLKKKQK